MKSEIKVKNNSKIQKTWRGDPASIHLKPLLLLGIAILLLMLISVHLLKESIAEFSDCLYLE